MSKGRWSKGKNLFCFSEGVKSLSAERTWTSFCVWRWRSFTTSSSWYAELLPDFASVFVHVLVFNGFGRRLHVDLHCDDADCSFFFPELKLLEFSEWIFMDQSICLYECVAGTDPVRPNAVTSSHTNQLLTESDRDGTGHGFRHVLVRTLIIILSYYMGHNLGL